MEGHVKNQDESGTQRHDFAKHIDPLQHPHADFKSSREPQAHYDDEDDDMDDDDGGGRDKGDSSPRHDANSHEIQASNESLTCQSLRTGHHILICGHQVVAPEAFVDAAQDMSPCAVNCARPFFVADAQHTYMCKACFASQFLRRYMPAGNYTTDEAIQHVQPMIEHMWAPVDIDGQMLVPTMAATEVSVADDQLISSMLAGLQVQEQDLDGLLGSMGGMTM